MNDEDFLEMLLAPSNVDGEKDDDDTPLAELRQDRTESRTEKGGTDKREQDETVGAIDNLTQAEMDSKELERLNSLTYFERTEEVRSRFYDSFL